MNDKHRTGVPFEADGDAERHAWDALGAIDYEEAPSARLRQRFYPALERAARPGWAERLGLVLGFARPTGWLSAAGFAATGVLLGLLAGGTGHSDAERLAALESSVQSLNKRLVLDRIDNESPTKRLRGVIDAVALVEDDPDVVQALLGIATEDRVYAVRSAAIDALGPGLGGTTVASEVMGMLETTESPHVQLALIDLVLRHGTSAQVEELVSLARGGRLFPALADHVLQSTGSEFT